MTTTVSTWTFTIPGEPSPKPRPRTFHLKDGKLGHYTPDDKHFVPRVQDRAIEAGVTMHEGPVRLSVLVHYEMPVGKPDSVVLPGVSKGWREIARGTLCATGTSDVVNVMANIADALEGVAYKNDKVVMWGPCERRWWNHHETIITVEQL